MNFWIVVVDDEPMSLRNAKVLLGTEGMKVSCLKSGRELLKFIEKNTPDLILLDLLMPEMDGFETYHAVRDYEEREGRRKTPVIFLTGEDDTESERRGLGIGASDFVHKPFDKDILISRITHTIENSRMIESLTEEATMDKLTGFFNKESGSKRLRELCESKNGFLMILDLDSFKLVNDLFGHDAGDQMLAAFAGIIKHNTREGDTVCRIGGDEFMAFFPDMLEKDDVRSLSDRLNRQLLNAARRQWGEEFDIPIGISIGAVLVPEEGRDYDQLFQMVDSALYKVKQNGKHGYAVYCKEEDIDTDGFDFDNEIDRISQIMEERSDRGGALLLGKESFALVYRFIMRFLKRYGGTSVKLLFWINSEAENVKDAAKQYEEFAAELLKTLRKSDIVIQNRSNQFFALLPELEEVDIPSVINRIKAHWAEHENAELLSIEYRAKFEAFKRKEFG